MKSQLSVFILIAGLIIAGGTVRAAENDRRKPPPGFQGGASARLAPESRTRISNSRAASLVKQRHGSSRILGVNLLERGGSPVYKIRTLSPDGVVKSIFVDGRTGEVFD